MAKTKFTRLSKTEMRKRREIARTEGYEFILKEATRDQDGEPFTVRLRRLSLQEKASLNGISQEMQNEIQEKTKALVASQEKNRSKTASEMVEVVRGNSALTDAVNTVVVAAMIDPLVTLDFDESEKDDNLWHIDDIHADDRWSIFLASTEPESEEAKSLRLFRPKT